MKTGVMFTAMKNKFRLVHSFESKHCYLGLKSKKKKQTKT